MKASAVLTLVLAAAVMGSPHRGRGGRGGNRGGNRGGAAAGGAVAGAGAAASTNTTQAAAPAAPSTQATSDQTGVGQATAGQTAATGAAGAAVARGANTLVLFEVNGVPGNECITFRNNGEMVDAACVNTAADRQLTPSTLASTGESVLLVQRSFSAGFRQDLVNTQACVGFNTTHFKALPCDDTSIELVSLVGDELKTASGACQSGHDNLAQVTVDPTGANCATFTTTTVAPAAA